MPDQINDLAQETYNALSKFVNSSRMYSKDVAKAMLKDHPLLQAYVTGLMVDMITAMAENDYVTPQNRQAVELCKQIKEAIGDYPQYL